MDVLSLMEYYKEKLAKSELYEKLAQAEMTLKNDSDHLDSEQVFERIKRKY